MLKERQGSTPKLDKETSKIVELIRGKVLPGINRTLKAPPFTDLDQNKLITKIAISEEAEIREKERTDRPIKKILPYYDELLHLGINPESIEEICYFGPEEVPYSIDTQDSTRLTVPKNFAHFFNGSLSGISNIIIMLDMIGAPQVKEVGPQIRPVAKKILKEHVIGTSLVKMIADSGLNPQDSGFDSIKTRICQDIDAEKTRLFFSGAKILGVLDGQTVDDCTFIAGLDIHKDVAALLAQPVLQSILPGIGINTIDTHAIMKEVRKKNKGTVVMLGEKIGLDLGSNEIQAESENYKLLLNLYLNSQIPLIAMHDFF